VELIFVTAPLLYYTSMNKYMMVPANGTTTQGDPIRGAIKRKEDAELERRGEVEMVSMANSWWTIGWCVFTWVLLVFLNVALWVLFGLGMIDDV